jgi:hypothetical protein
MKTLLFAGLSAVMLVGSVAVNAQATEQLQTLNLAQLPSPVLVAEKANVLAQGTFVTVEQDHATTGIARIVSESGQHYLEFDSEFDTARGPAVEVVLYTGDTVPVNLAEGDYVVIGTLQRFEGAQRYPIPENIALEDYESAAIWCAEFNVTFGYADL